MIQFRKDVVLVHRDLGGAFLIDLAGDSYALPEEQALFASLLASKQIGHASHEQASTVPDDFLQELTVLALIDQPASLRSRGLRWLNRMRAMFIVACLHVAIAACRSPHKLASRLLGLSYLHLKCCSWPVTVETWTKFFNRQSPWRKWFSNSLTVDQAGVIVQDHAARHVFAVRCKERSLTLFALCRLAGHFARIHAGCSPTIFQLHCWLESSDGIVGDDASLCADFNTIATWS